MRNFRGNSYIERETENPRPYSILYENVKIFFGKRRDVELEMIWREEKNEERKIPWMRRTDDVKNVRQMRNDAIFHQPTILVAFEPANRKIARSLAGKIVKRDFCVLTQSKEKIENFNR
jgi:hypothetical protein